MRYIYASARHRRSGSTMQKSKSPGEMQRYMEVRRVFPGFPAKPFSRIEDVEDYVSGDRITCLVCGRQFKDPTKHIVRVHQISIADYRVRFNIPSKYSLLVPATRELLVKNAYRINQDGRLERALEERAKTRNKRREKAKMTAFGKAVQIAKIINYVGRGVSSQPNRIDTDYTWHLEQVATVYAFKSVKPPKGEIAWRTYKTRRRKDPALNAAHMEARKRWERDHRGSWKNKR